MDRDFPAHYREGRPFLYADNCYWRCKTKQQWARLIRNGVHLSERLERPADRYEALFRDHSWPLLPWRKGGRSVVVIPPSRYQIAALGCSTWEAETVARLRAITDRPILVKAKIDGNLVEYLSKHDAFALVTYASVAGFEAATLGYPIFATDKCCTWPINAGPLERIETPEYHERLPWLHALAYAQWHIDEIYKLDSEDYAYQCVS